MSGRQIKLGAVVTGAGGPGQDYRWLDPEIPGDASVNINWYIEQAQLAELAKFDLIFIVDSQFITADSPPHYLNRLEPLTLLSALAVVTRQIGLVGTLTTSYNDPFSVARRDPDDMLVLPGVTVFVGDTDEDGREIEHETQLADHDFDRALGELGRPFGWHDFRQYDLDAPFPDVLHAAQRSFRTQAEKIVQLARDNNYTLRQTVQKLSGPKPTPFAGSPETVANELQRWFTERAVDGYLIHVGHPAQFRRFIKDVVPILVERGLFRTEYEAGTLRGNLGIPVPENRYTQARRERTSLPRSRRRPGRQNQLTTKTIG